MVLASCASRGGAAQREKCCEATRMGKRATSHSWENGSCWLGNARTREKPELWPVQLASARCAAAYCAGPKLKNSSFQAAQVKSLHLGLSFFKEPPKFAFRVPLAFPEAPSKKQKRANRKNASHAYFSPQPHPDRRPHPRARLARRLVAAGGLQLGQARLQLREPLLTSLRSLRRSVEAGETHGTPWEARGNL